MARLLRPSLNWLLVFVPTALALREGLYSVVKASITGSIIGNVLLVLGVSLVAGGLRHPTQRFNEAGHASSPPR